MHFRLPLLLLGASLPLRVEAQACTPEPLALVLAGGGAKGFAHIGVIRALDSMGVRPDLVVGTSIGAIVGALYASGLSGRQIDSVTREISSTDLSAGLANRSPHNWGNLVPLLLWEQGRGTFNLVTGGESELRTSALLNRMLLRANLIAGGDFDRLPIRFRAVATDLRTRETVVLAGGDLVQAVRASSAIPLVFSPEPIGNRVLIDGGISANVPIAEARAAGARRVIVVDLRDEGPADSVDITSPAGVAGQLAGFLFRQPLEPLGPDDIHIRPDVRGFANLDFQDARRRRLVANGRAAADSVLRRARCLPASPPLQIPALPGRLTGWEVANGSARDGELMGRVLGLSQGQEVHVDVLADHLADAIGLEVFRQIWLGPAGSGDTVRFHAQVVPAARRVAGLGVAYDHDLGGRLWLGGLDRTSIRGAEGSAVVTLGRFKSDLSGSLVSHLGIGRMRLSPTGSVRLRSQSVRQFDEAGENYEKLSVREGSGAAGLEWARLGRWRLSVGGTAMFWRTPEGENRSSGGTFLALRTDPGLRIHAGMDLTWMGDFQLARGELGTRIRSGRLTLVPAVRAGIGRRLPVQTAFEFGGDEGFPGLEAGELRGDRELLARLSTSWQVRGPVALRALFAAGRSATGGSLFDSEDWLAGVRLGIGATTPIGPVNFEYGFASNGRTAAFIRVGEWF